MNNITHKNISLRTAKAAGLVLCHADTIELIKNNKVPKGNMFEFAKAAALLGAKQTQHLLPHCHPVSIDGMDVRIEILDIKLHKEYFTDSILSKSGIAIIVEASSIGRTGIEMEVLTGISIAALEIYDFLKPVDKHLEITSIRLLDKKGGKSDLIKTAPEGSVCAVLVCSDSVSKNIKQDGSGILLKQMLEDKGATVSDYKIVPDNIESIQTQIKEWVNNHITFIFTTGGTGLGPVDVTIEAVKELIEKEVPGIAEAMRESGRGRTPTAILSRSIAGIVDKSLIIALPGSPKGVSESLNAILPAIFHAASVMEGKGH